MDDITSLSNVESTSRNLLNYILMPSERKKRERRRGKREDERGGERDSLREEGREARHSCEKGTILRAAVPGIFQDRFPGNIPWIFDLGLLLRFSCFLSLTYPLPLASTFVLLSMLEADVTRDRRTNE